MWTDINKLGKYKSSLKSRKKAMGKIFEEWETRPARQLMFEKVALENDDFFFDQKKDVTANFIADVEWAIKNQANMLVGIEAPPGEGKSWVGLWLDTIWQKKMAKILKTTIKIEFAFDSAQAKEKLAKIRDKDLVHKDEDTTMIGRGKTTAIAEETNFAETMRFSQKSMVICAPHIPLLSGMTTLLRPMARLKTEDPNKFQTRVLWYQLEEDQPGRSPKYILMGYIIADIRDIDVKLIERYKKLKEVNFRQIEKNRGAVGAVGKAELRELTRAARKILKYAMNKRWPANPMNPSKKALTEFFLACQIPVQGESEDIIKGIVVRLYKEGRGPITKITENQGDKLVEKIFDVDEKGILDQIWAENSTSETIARDIEIYEASKDPLKTAEMFVQKYGISAARVGQIKQAMVGRVEEKIGNKFEDFLDPHLRLKYAVVQHMGGVGKPDFVCQDTAGNYSLYSVKCFNFARGSKSVPYTESDAEIKEARQIFQATGKLPRVFLYAFNRFNQKVWEMDIDPVVIEKIIPYTSRTHVLKLDQYTRDPASSSWV